MNTKIKVNILFIILISASSLRAQVFLEANNSDSAYGLLGSKGYGYEVPDCKHNVPHIN
jgi:hypothetical protein